MKLAHWLESEYNVKINASSMFDIQVIYFKLYRIMNLAIDNTIPNCILNVCIL